MDGNKKTKWLDKNGKGLVFQFDKPFDSYHFTSANDAYNRDPIKWRI